MRQGQCSVSVALTSACILVSLGELLKSLRLRFHLRSTESEPLGWDPGLGIFLKSAPCASNVQQPIRSTGLFVT